MLVLSELTTEKIENLAGQLQLQKPTDKPLRLMNGLEKYRLIMVIVRDHPSLVGNESVSGLLRLIRNECYAEKAKEEELNAITLEVLGELIHQ